MPDYGNCCFSWAPEYPIGHRDDGFLGGMPRPWPPLYPPLSGEGRIGRQLQSLGRNLVDLIKASACRSVVDKIQNVSQVCDVKIIQDLGPDRLSCIPIPLTKRCSHFCSHGCHAAAWLQQ